MKTIKSKILYALMALSTAMMSCQKTCPDTGMAGGRIIPRLSTNALTKSDMAVSEQIKLYEYSGKDLSVTLFEEDNLSRVCDAPTKGNIVTNSWLNKNGKQFRMDAWLGSTNRYNGSQDGNGRVYEKSDKDNYHFIMNGTATFNDGKWALGSDHYWRNKVPTSFWSVYPSSVPGCEVSWPGDKAADDAQKTLSFTYDIPSLEEGAGAEGQQDICVAFSYKTWTDDSDNAVDIDFNHALSAVLFDVSDLPEGISVTKIAISGLKGKGTCTVTGSTDGTESSKGVTFEWTTSENNRNWSQSFDDGDFESDGEQKVTNASSNKIFMLIPQTLTSDTKLAVTFFDGTNTTTKEATIGDGSSTVFRAGKKYTFTINVEQGVRTPGKPTPYDGRLF